MLVYLICYGISFLLARRHLYVPSGLLLIGAAVWLYMRDYLRTKNLIHLRGLFCLAFVGGQGVSCFKLSRLQTDWQTETWVCFLLGTAAFWLAFEGMERRKAGGVRGSADEGEAAAPVEAKSGGKMPEQEHAGTVPKRPGAGGNYPRRLLIAMAGVTGLAWAAFLFEAFWLGFVPLFSYGVPHAYSYFHVTGVHYFTVSSVLVPSMAVVYGAMLRRRGGNLQKSRGFWAAVVLAALSLALPVLCVSRFQLIMAAGMALFTFISINEAIRLRYVLLLAAFMIPAYLGLTVMRSHSVSYLNGIFEMKNSATPIFITQPYMYIANNYDNFNCLVEGLEEYAWGRRMLFPLWAFTGLKFVAPFLVNFPLFVTKEELTTVTLFYDAYYDFGLAGMILFGAVLGVICCFLVRRREREHSMAEHLVYAQIAMYMALSFFTTWFSNPTTWFYLGMTGAVCWYVGRGGKYARERK